VAITALQRAAVLSADAGTRARRLTRAAELALDAGLGQAGLSLLEEAFRLDLPAAERTRIAFMIEVLRPTAWSGDEDIRAYGRAAGELMASGDAGLALHALGWGAMRMHWTNLEDRTRGELAAVVARFPDRDHPERLGALALIDPVGHGGEVLARLSRLTPLVAEDPEALFAFGSAAAAVWSPNLGLPFLHAAVEGFRREGRPGRLAHSLSFVAWDELRRGSMRAAATAADQAARLCSDTAQPLYTATARVAEVIAQTERGAAVPAEQRLAEAEGMFLAIDALPLLALVQMARGRLALTAERYGEACARLIRIFDPEDAAYHQFTGGWVLADLAEAAVHGGGGLEQVGAIISRWAQIAELTNAGYLRVQLEYAGALLAKEDQAAERFEYVISHSSAGWPYYRARTQLAYGSWLRRRRHGAQARQPLREAAETLDALGAAVLAGRARRELRASGERVPRRTLQAWDQLSPQELQIAELAASGLSNRQIGERLYLSHRTVGTHLYRLFPKLGVTSRAELGTVLDRPARAPGLAARAAGGGELTSSDLRAAWQRNRSVGIVGRPDLRSPGGRRCARDDCAGVGSRAGGAGERDDQDAGGIRPRAVAAAVELGPLGGAVRGGRLHCRHRRMAR
jgi:DNA-binding CsgD family transcriptional regulator